MQRVALSTYRQLYKKAALLDKDVAVRTLLVCTPPQMYSPRHSEWVQLNIPAVEEWSEAATFCDQIIRIANGNREFYAPPVHAPEAKAEAVASGQESDAAEESETTGAAQVGGAQSVPTGVASQAASIPMQSTLCKMIRSSFDSMPLSVSSLNAAFAVLKELTEVVEISKEVVVAELPPSPTGVSQLQPPAPPMAPAAVPKDTGDVSIGRLALSKAGKMEALHAAIREGQAKREAGSSATATTTDDAPEAPPATTSESAPGESAVAVEAEPVRVSGNVQLLVAHPMMPGFFHHTVSLVLRVTPSDAIALILNKPLEDKEGMLMPVGASLRLNKVHPIYATHLSAFPLMVGGPVSFGALDETVFILHRCPEIPNATRLTDTIFLDGDLDVLQARLDDGSVKLADITVLCGYSAWGADQLQGEARIGSWVIADVPGDHPNTDDYLFSLTKMAVRSADEATTGDAAIKAPPETKTVFSIKSFAAWRSVLEALGEPFRSLSRNGWSALREDGKRKGR